MWIAFRAFKGRDPQAKAEFFAIDALHQCGAIMLDHLWNQRMERDRSTNLLHFKMVIMNDDLIDSKDEQILLERIVCYLHDTP
mmetsp:Transcript_27299/g.43928  ORF Transcript_27299/g.43928 Transcript_27299/m.43928 type:complete len:83 (+) Transcript_27299:232-480(+)